MVLKSSNASFVIILTITGITLIACIFIMTHADLINYALLRMISLLIFCSYHRQLKKKG